ncbi:DUF1523 family protein [Wenxinia marina]|uniref:DUF1523 domain-containing protein n=1 Tax=Wenxinia marina DSM 24838 TaxID=1123501 RepID=A0A0D0NJ59_9RHOB|nr:DUF1523 family protein [Wenxinia marina]KIQ68385.1 hypothetical protein Wenmar_03032 [Wenxinia marina DSM 24838]GGL72628.1 hypothetical protein GCM10011392_29040 [Wenxinia marina]
MLRYIWWAIRLAVLLVVVLFLHYTLPQRDIVYVTGVEIKLEQFGENSIFWASPDSGAASDGGMVERDVRFIDTVQRDGDVMVYRNEDTGVWPPYFKFDSSNLQAEARDLVSTRDAPQWVVMTHYGWRIPFLTAFPNAVGVRPIDDPDVTLIPWLNIAIIVVLIAIWWAIRVRWKRLRRARIDPSLRNADAALAERRAGMQSWLRSWRRR